MVSILPWGPSKFCHCLVAFVKSVWCWRGLLFLLHVEKSQAWQACRAQLRLPNSDWTIEVFKLCLTRTWSVQQSNLHPHSSVVSRQAGPLPVNYGFLLLFLHLALLSYSNNLGKSYICGVLIGDDMLRIWKNSHLPKESGLSCYHNSEANYGTYDT